MSLVKPGMPNNNVRDAWLMLIRPGKDCAELVVT